MAYIDPTLHTEALDRVLGRGSVFTTEGDRRLAEARISALHGSSVGVIGPDPLALATALLESARGILAGATDAELHQPGWGHTQHLAASLAARFARDRSDEGMDRLLAAVRGERWPTAADVADEVHRDTSCGLGGCTPADPCGACRSLAGLGDAR